MRTAAALLAAAAVLLPGCGADDEPAAVRTSMDAMEVRTAGRLVGEGATGVWVFRPRGAPRDARLPTVVFLHGWTATAPDAYGPWIDHLVDGGRQVLLPVYQVPPYLSPRTAFANVVAGLRRAERVAPVDRRDVAAVGHSAGGALAEDLAAAAPRLGLPRPRVVLAAYPGRGFGFRGDSMLLPEATRRGTPRGVRLVAMAGDDDPVVGTRWARRMAQRAADGRYVLVRDAAVDDHLGPQRADAASRRTFWARFDALLRRR